MAERTHRNVSPVWFVIAAVVAAVLLIAPTGMTSRAAAQEPPTELAPPAAPDRFGVDDGVTWVDNSDNEDGFRILIMVNRTEHVFEVGENVTVFEYPEGLIPACGNIDYEIRAFNEAGESSPLIAVLARVGCREVEPEILPEAGSGQGSGAFPYALVIAALAGAGLTLISVAGLRVRRG